jgi:hypothetical protein
MKGAVMADPPYTGTTFLDRNIIITPQDPTTFSRKLFTHAVGEVSMYDRRVDAWKPFWVYAWEANFDDGLAAVIHVNREFGNIDVATTAALKYCEAIGRLPTVLRTKLKTVSIHPGEAFFGGGYNNLVIHTGQADKYERDGVLEEVLLHEACHTTFEDSLNSAAAWIAAREADKGTFISTYARDNPQREDIAESFLCWLAVRYRSDRISKADADKILGAIPNRLAYFDAQGFDMYPIAWGEDAWKGRPPKPHYLFQMGLWELVNPITGEKLPPGTLFGEGQSIPVAPRDRAV